MHELHLFTRISRKEWYITFETNPIKVIGDESATKEKAYKCHKKQKVWFWDALFNGGVRTNQNHVGRTCSCFCIP